MGLTKDDKEWIDARIHQTDAHISASLGSA